MSDPNRDKSSNDSDQFTVHLPQSPPVPNLKDQQADPPKSSPADETSHSQAVSFSDRATIRPADSAPHDPAPSMTHLAGGASTESVSLSAQRLGDFDLYGEIARGGMGVVYKARQISVNRIVALKVVLAGMHADPDDVERFRREAEAAANLEHPGIVPIYGAGTLEGRPYIAMALIEGGNLAHRLLFDGALSNKEAARLTYQLAEAVSYAHQQGLIHRDLKPANVLLTKGGQPKITDFGLARRITDSSLTAKGQIMGTPTFMAPEQALGKNEATGPASDTYSLGAILYAMLVGRPPFQAATPVETMRQVVENDPLRPRQLNPEVARDLETICLKCLQKDPHRRYESAQALAEDLNRYLHDKPTKARPVNWWERTVKWVKRKPTIASLIVLVVLVLAVGVTVSTHLALTAIAAENRAKEEAQKATNLSERLFRDQTMLEARSLANAIRGRLRLAIDDTQKILEFPPIPGIVRTWDKDIKEKDGSQAQDWVKRLEETLKSQLKTSPVARFDQELPDQYALLMDITGKEILRVEWRDREIIRAPETQLGTLRNEPFFKATVKLKAEQFHVSTWRPMANSVRLSHSGEQRTVHSVVQVCAPVMDEHQRVWGVFVLAFDAQKLSFIARKIEKRFGKVVKENGVELYVVDESGTYLYHRSSKKCFNLKGPAGTNYFQEHPQRNVPWTPLSLNDHRVPLQSRFLEKDGQLLGAQLKLYYDPDTINRYWLIDLAVPSNVTFDVPE